MPMAKSSATAFSLVKEFLLCVAVSGTMVMMGHWIDRQEDLRMTKFRDKSALYGRELKPDEPPSWP